MSSTGSSKSYVCQKCNKRFSGLNNLEQHLLSDKHKKQLELEKKSQELESKLSEFTTELPNTFCDECDKKFSGPEPYFQHMKSESHRKKVRKNKLESEEEEEDESYDWLKVEDEKQKSNNLNCSNKTTDKKEFFPGCVKCELKYFKSSSEMSSHYNSLDHAKTILVEHISDKLGLSEPLSSLKEISPEIVYKLLAAPNV